MREAEENLPLSLLKIVLLGPKACGKTAITNRISGQEMSSDYQTTIGVDFMSKLFLEPEYRLKLHLWDLAGDKKFHNIATHYISSARIILAVYDSTDVNSATECAKLLRKLVRDGNTTKDHRFIVVGTKSDKENNKLALSMGNDIANSMNSQHIHVSSVTGDGIEELVFALKDMSPRPPSPYMLISEKQEEPKKRDCIIM